MSKSQGSLLFCVAKRVAPSLLAMRQEDSDEVLRHLQLLSTDFIDRCSSQEAILTPYILPKEQKGTDVEKNSTKCTMDASSFLSARGEGDEVYPIRTALDFALGEKTLCNQMHFFELNVFLALLRRPSRDYTHIVFWNSLIGKLEGLDFYSLMYTNIARMWDVIKQQRHVLGIHSELCLLQLLCDTVLLFSEHALRLNPKEDVLRGFVLLAQQMWSGDAPLTVRRCAIVISVFLSKHTSLVPLDVLCADRMSPDAPYLLAVLAATPVLSSSCDRDSEQLRKALEVVFSTRVYSLPVMMYFRSDGAFSAVLHVVRQRFASILYELFADVSGEFWGYFLEDSLLSAAEAIALYSSQWNSFPSGVHALWRRVRNDIVEKSDVCTVSLFNFCTAASAYHLNLGELEDMTAIVDKSETHYITQSVPLEGGAEDEGAAHSRNTESLVTIAATSPLRKTFRLLTAGWISFCGGEKLLVRSTLYLLHAMLWNYHYEQADLEQLVGCNVQSLFQQLATSFLAERVDDVEIVEALYGTISRFHGLLGNIGYAASNLLTSDIMKGVGIRHNTTEIALLQLLLYSTLFEAYEGVVSFGRILEAVVHIQPGFMTCSSLALPFFVQWLSIVQTVLSGTSCSIAPLLSFEGSQEKLIHWLCEGVFVLARELQSGNIFLGIYPIMRLLEGLILLLSTAVMDRGHHNTLATCVIVTPGEKTLSACFMLYCLLFASNAKSVLVESTAGLLTYVVEHSQEKLFTTMRFHTSMEMKRSFLSAVHQQLQPLTMSSTAMNVVRLESLRYLLRLDPASFYYLLVPEEADSGAFSELPIIHMLRDMVRSNKVTALEKAEALGLLSALDDLDLSTAEVAALLSDTKYGAAYIQSAFTAAVANYICGVLLSEACFGYDQTLKSTEKGSQRSPGRMTANVGRGKALGTHSSTVRLVLNSGCETLNRCRVFYKDMERELQSIGRSNDLVLSPHYTNRKDSRQLISSRATHDFQSILSTISGGATTTTTAAHHGSFFLPPKRAFDSYVKLRPLLLGDGFLLWEGENAVLMNRMASTLESVTRLTASLETAVWFMQGEKEVSLAAITLLEVALNGVCMVELDVVLLRSFIWSCLDSWLALARAATFVIEQASAGSVLSVSTATLNPLFQNVLKVIAFSNENIDFVSRGLGILTLFQPSNASDEAIAIHIFELIANVLGKYRSIDFSTSFVTLLSECSVIFSRLGSFCPLQCALSTLESLWLCGICVSRMIPATEPPTALSDVFDHIMDAVNTLLLHCEGLADYFSHKRVMIFANALGQSNHAGVYDPATNLYRPQAWHRAWLSVLRLLHTVLVKSETDGPSQAEWLTAISSLVTTSPRFKDAVSGFTLFTSAQEVKPLAWELCEMQLCTTIIALLASFGVLTSFLTPHVRRCFCYIRRYRIQTMTAVDERTLESILVTTVRHQLSFLILQPPPPSFTGEVLLIVTIDRHIASLKENSSVLTGGLLQQRVMETDEEAKMEEQLSFDVLHFFILRELKIIRKSHLDNPGPASISFSPEHTPLLHSSFATMTSLESFTEAEFREGCSKNVTPHIDSVQLALALFVRYARLHLGMRSLSLLERQELAVAVDKLFHALSRLIHEVRRLCNSRLTWVVETVREELQDLAGLLQSGW